jgi:predicted DNA-binding transcriptional regulator AlpA
MSEAIPNPPQQGRDRLIRKKELLEKLSFSKSTLHSKLDRKSSYFDSTFPRPIYAPETRIPYWRLGDIEDWIAAFEQRGVDRKPRAPIGAVVPGAAKPPASPAKPGKSPKRGVALESVAPITPINGLPPGKLKGHGTPAAIIPRQKKPSQSPVEEPIVPASPELQTPIAAEAETGRQEYLTDTSDAGKKPHQAQKSAMLLPHELGVDYNSPPEERPKDEHGQDMLSALQQFPRKII